MSHCIGDRMRSIQLAKGILVAAYFLTMSKMALAQTVAGQSLPTIDQVNAQGATENGIAEGIMRGLLGGVFDDPFGFGGVTTLFGVIFLSFNIFVFAAAVAFGTYGVVAGIVQTAHEGVVLGKRLNAIWMPIRMVTGIGSLVPAFGGFSLSQAIMILALGWGINGANYITNQALTALSNFTPLTNPSVVRGNPVKNANDMVTALFFQRLCYLGHLKQDEEHQRLGVERAEGSRLTDMSDRFPDQVRAQRAVGSMYGNLEPEGALKCFGVGVVASQSYQGLSSSDEPSPGSAALDVGSQYRNFDVDYRSIREGAYARHSAAFASVKQAVNALADEYVSAYDRAAQAGGALPAFPAAQIRSLSSQFASAAMPPPSEGQDQVSAVKNQTVQRIRELGFLSLGQYHQMISEVNTALANAQNSVEYKILMPSQDSSFSGVVGSGESGMKYAAHAKNSASVDLSGIGGGDTGAGAASLLDHESASGGWTFGKSLLNAALGGLVTDGGQGFNGSFALVDPIISAKNVGDYLLITGQAIVGANSVLSIFGGNSKDKDGESSGSGGSSSLAGMLGKTLSALNTIGWVMIMLGVMLAIYIPFVPFMNWVAAVVQYVSTVVQSFVAAPLWSFAHMTAEGEGMGQRAEKGYMFIMLVLFKPSLMVIAFFAASGMVILVGSVVSALFMPAVAQVQGNSITGLVSILGFIGLFFVILNTIIQTSFNLVEEISDDVIGWIGSAGKSRVGSGADDRAGNVFMAGAKGSRGDATAVAATLAADRKK